jgi:hypothetical protein
VRVCPGVIGGGKVWAGEGFVARKSKALRCIVARGGAESREERVSESGRCLEAEADDNVDEQEEDTSQV